MERTPYNRATTLLCDGPSLAVLLARAGPVPLRAAVSLLALVADAVQYAHAHGVVHRDLKPDNILLVESPYHAFALGDASYSPKVIDFGLARLLDDDSGLTTSGACLGAPQYMAPEQADGRSREAGPAADVYSLGVILYEALAGRLPFSGGDTAELRRRVVEDAPPPLPAAIPADLRAVCLKCLEKGSADRYPRAADLADDLRRFLAGGPVAARPVGRLRSAWWRHRAAAGLVALVVAAAVAAVGWWLLSSRTARPATSSRATGRASAAR